MSDRAQLLADLRAEGDRLDAVVTALPAADWRRPTPAEGWTIAHQVAHLAWTDDQALRAATDPEGFARAVVEAGPRVLALVDEAAAAGAVDEPEPLLARWRTGRAALADALGALPVDARLPWFGPPMGAPSMVTARLMETWAHGVDVTDALGRPPSVSDRLRHVAHIGVRTRDFAFRQHGVRPPAAEFRIELTAPDGDIWRWGSDAAAQGVAGPALDFCLRVTQRRHRDDLALTVVGSDADRWLDLAQAFAGPPGPGRPPGGAR